MTRSWLVPQELGHSRAHRRTTYGTGSWGAVLEYTLFQHQWVLQRGRLYDPLPRRRGLTGLLGGPGREHASVPAPAAPIRGPAARLFYRPRVGDSTRGQSKPRARIVTRSAPARTRQGIQGATRL